MSDGLSIAPPRLVDSLDGAIKQVLIALPAARIDANRDLATVLLADRFPGAERVIVTHQRTESLTRELAGAGRVRILACPDDSLLTIWCQDALVAHADGSIAPSGRRSTVIPSRVLFDRLAAEGFAVRDLDGNPARAGNLLVGDDFVLVGADEWRRWGSATTGGSSDREAAALELFRLRLDDSRRPIVIGGGSGRSAGPSRPFDGPDGRRWLENTAPGIVERASLQPAYHIDLYLTLAGRASAGGRYRILVGDPLLAATLAQASGPPPPFSTAVLAKEFDAVAAALFAKGFDVERCPLPLVWRDDPGARRRHWYFASYNNALAEDAGPASRRIVLPAFGELGEVDLRACDRYVADLWSRFGFRVEQVLGLGPLAQRGGGLHCALKVLARART